MLDGIKKFAERNGRRLLVGTSYFSAITLGPMAMLHALNSLDIGPGSFSGSAEASDERLPEVRDNQSLILHPDYLNGTVSLGYTLLTDVDHDGIWDQADRVHGGFTTGDYSRNISFRKGYEPTTHSPDVEYHLVDSDFFFAFQ